MTLQCGRPQKVSKEACAKKWKHVFAKMTKSWHWYVWWIWLKVKYWHFKPCFLSKCSGNILCNWGHKRSPQGRISSDRLYSTVTVLAKVKLWWKETEKNVRVQAQIYCRVKLQEETVNTAAHAKTNKNTVIKSKKERSLSSILTHLYILHYTCGKSNWLQCSWNSAYC